MELHIGNRIRWRVHYHVIVIRVDHSRIDLVAVVIGGVSPSTGITVIVAIVIGVATKSKSTTVVVGRGGIGVYIGIPPS